MDSGTPREGVGHKGEQREGWTQRDKRDKKGWVLRQTSCPTPLFCPNVQLHPSESYSLPLCPTVSYLYSCVPLCTNPPSVSYSLPLCPVSYHLLLCPTLSYPLPLCPNVPSEFLLSEFGFCVRMTFISHRKQQQQQST